MATGAYSVDPEFAQMLEETTGKASNFRSVTAELSSGKEVPIKVHDHSMAPVIVPGDLMVFGPSSLEATRAGDIVLYRLRDRAVARRVLRKTIKNGEAVFITKSLSSSQIDQPIRVASVMGRLLHVERKGKRIKARSLNRGIIDKLTDYGSKSVGAKLMSYLWILLPVSMRPDQAA